MKRILGTTENLFCGGICSWSRPQNEISNPHQAHVTDWKTIVILVINQGKMDELFIRSTGQVNV